MFFPMVFLHVPLVFLWFSFGFPLVLLGFPYNVSKAEKQNRLVSYVFVVLAFLMAYLDSGP